MNHEPSLGYAREPGAGFIVWISTPQSDELTNRRTDEPSLGYAREPGIDEIRADLDSARSDEP